ncbi:hypothetical protein ANN_06065 [Periplaneta americana]|uniref:Uncharacterized protein n=1 Tax=Periplaneta americana TaxID=6978 RepID=A0ABQ8TEA1_PERAM|nr:hypothetical protein ANN_06065 [Periplaneta americana]
MAGLCEGGNEPPGSLKAKTLRRLWDAVRRKRPEKWVENNWFLMHDNAPAHRAIIVKNFLARHNITALDHPPYSRDLSPPDYFLFPRLKSHLKGRRLNAEEVIANATRALRRVSKMASRPASRNSTRVGKSVQLFKTKPKLDILRDLKMAVLNLTEDNGQAGDKFYNLVIFYNDEVRFEDSPKDYPAFAFWLGKTSEKPNQVMRSKGRYVPYDRWSPFDIDVASSSVSFESCSKDTEDDTTPVSKRDASLIRGGQRIDEGLTATCSANVSDRLRLPPLQLITFPAGASNSNSAEFNSGFATDEELLKSWRVLELKRTNISEYQRCITGLDSWQNKRKTMIVAK